MPEATWAQSSLAVPAQVPGCPVSRGKTDFRQVPRRKPMVVAEVLQRHRTSRIYREENSCPRSQLQRSCRLRACCCDLPSDAGDPGMLMT